MNPIGPRPYTNGQYKKEEGSEEKTRDSLHQNSGGRHQQQNQQHNPNQQNKQQPERKTIAKGVQTTAPTGPRRHVVPNNGGKNDAYQPQASPRVTPVVNNAQPSKQMQPILRAPQQPQQPQQIQEQPIQPMIQEVKEEAPTKGHAITAANNKINIAQILKDFYNTIDAIGTPGIIREEVQDYLKEVETHCNGEAPSIEFVQTNLRNAANILDRYISETLEKESKVVIKWLEALFLQRINYRFNNGEINKAFLVKFPGDDKKEAGTNEGVNQGATEDTNIIQESEVKENKPTQYEPIGAPIEQPQKIRVEQTVTDPIQDYTPQRPQMIEQPVQVQQTTRIRHKTEVVVIPQDNELKSLFIQAKKQVFANNPSKAMDIFHRALIRAQQINDGETESKICLEIGQIYDDNNYTVQALMSYNRSLINTTDNNVKTKVHYSMAQIYDDVNQVTPALDHYLTSVSYAGANDNLVSQSTSLTKIANIFSSQYDEKAFEFYEEANLLVDQTRDSKTKGFVSSNTAGAYTRFNVPEKALKYYANAVKNYTVSNSQDNIVENYKAAAELMIDYKNPAKAKVLLKKALVRADKIKDAKLIDEINTLMEEVC